MILHTPDTITIRRYTKFEQSKDLRVLFRYYVPKWYALKYAGKFINQFNQLFNNKTESEDLVMFDKLQYQNKILLMQVLLTAVQLHLSEKIQLDILKHGNKVQPDDKLQYYFDEIELVWGKKIEKIEDITAFRAEIERKIDKYAEIFPQKEVKKEGVSLIELAISVYRILNMTVDLDISLSEFAVLNELAVKESKKMQAQIDKAKQNGRD